MSSREDEAIAVEPLGVFGVEPHEFIPQDERHWRCTHWQTGVTGVGFFYGIDRQKADAVDAEFFERLFGWSRYGHSFFCVNEGRLSKVGLVMQGDLRR